MSDVNSVGDEVDVDGDDIGNRVEGGTARGVLEFLAKEIVDDPESVVIEVEEGRQGVLLRLHVAPDDMGKVIGRRGRVAQAIRTVVRAAGARDGSDAQVDIVD
ncbi:MAG TPA: KH domain-containing protein [Acidimicrobiales bacterium]|nr:KH domain-containing protein [Acidimicrobiales bacterium]